MIRTLDGVDVAFRANENGRFGSGNFNPTYSPPQSNGNVMLRDDLGGVSLHPIGGISNDEAVYDPSYKAWLFPLESWQNFWISVFPPRPYNWNRASQRVFWKYACYGNTPENTPYQDISSIDSEFFSNIQDANKNILLLQSEAALWKNWNLEFVPRKSVQPPLYDYIRDADANKLSVVVYASPYYFTKDHPRPKFRNYEWDSCSGTPVANAFGENSQEYLAAVTTLLQNYPSLGGLYLDEIYPFNLPESYAVILEIRKLLGPDKTIIYHNTVQTVFTPWIDSNNFYEEYWQAAKNTIICPTVDAYADFTLTGELPGDQHLRLDQTYLKNRLSTYNISNAVGLLGNYFVYFDRPESDPNIYAPNLDTGGKRLFESLAKDILGANARIPCRELLHDPRHSSTLQFWDSLERYWNREPSNEKEYLTLLYSGAYSSQVFGRLIGEHFVGDFDGNGESDLAFFEPGDPTADYGKDSMYIRVTRKGTWAAFPGWQNGAFGHSSGKFFIGDFDGDGRADFSFLEATNVMHILLNKETGYQIGNSYFAGSEDGEFFVGDFDGDGKDDFGFFVFANNSMRISLNRGTYWEPGIGFDTFGHRNGKFYIGDFDGDARSDFAFFEPANNSMYVALNKVSGYVVGQEWDYKVFGHTQGEFLIGDFNGDRKSDFAFIEPGPTSHLPSYYTTIYTRLNLQKINSIVKFNLLPWTYKPPTSDTSGCPDGYKWKFSFEARLSTGENISDTTVEVKTLTKPNLLLNADYGPGREGARLTIPFKDGYSDGLLTTTPFEYVDVPFTICMKEIAPFSFYVDLLGTIKE